MNVVVDDHHALEAPLESPSGSDRHVVEEAEAHRPISLRVVPGRADRAEGPIQIPLEHTLDRVHDRTRGEQGCSGTTWDLPAYRGSKRCVRPFVLATASR